MTGRTFNALMLCLTLLFAGLPAFACDPSADASDCCDPNGTLPCGGDQTANSRVIAVDCCAASASVVAEAPTSPEFSFTSDIEYLPSAYSLIAQNINQSIRVSFYRLTPPDGSGTQLYLETGRLRL